MKKLFIITFTISLLLLGGCKKATTSPTYVQGFFFNTYINITIHDELTKEKAETITECCLDLCRSYEMIFSRTNENSELHRLNTNGTLTCSDELVSAINTGVYYSSLSNGAFDITIAPLSDLWNFSDNPTSAPDDSQIKNALLQVSYNNIVVEGNNVTLKNNARIDLGAIAKGIIADRLKDYLKEQNIHHAIIDLGGNILLVGGKTSSQNFIIGIKKPFAQNNEMLLTLSLSDYSVVSSGIYERYFYEGDNFYHHLLNPVTGYPYENDLAGITIIAKSSETCDALSTTCYCLGPQKGMELINSLTDTYAVFVTKDGTLIYSDNFKENITILK